jgi:hypothetical protein
VPAPPILAPGGVVPKYYYFFAILAKKRRYTVQDAFWNDTM